jgi:hypothetical protein
MVTDIEGLAVLDVGGLVVIRSSPVRDADWSIPVPRRRRRRLVPFHPQRHAALSKMAAPRGGLYTESGGYYTRAVTVYRYTSICQILGI